MRTTIKEKAKEKGRKKEKEREEEDVFRRAEHAWGGGGGMERERGVLV